MMMFDISHIFPIKYDKELYCMIGCGGDFIVQYGSNWEYRRVILNKVIKYD